MKSYNSNVSMVLQCSHVKMPSATIWYFDSRNRSLACGRPGRASIASGLLKPVVSSHTTAQTWAIKQHETTSGNKSMIQTLKHACQPPADKPASDPAGKTRQVNKCKHSPSSHVSTCQHQVVIEDFHAGFAN